MYPLKYGEFKQIKRQLEEDITTSDQKNGESLEVNKLSAITKRVKDYCHKVYAKVKIEEIETREATICQRENSFYTNTVRSFRDRRYEYKLLTKKWNSKLKEATKTGNISFLLIYFDI